jgi:hypothetical protein
MAMDYLPVQASSVPSKRVFSSSAETDTKRRNRINPILMEALQILKFHLKKERLSFTSSWMTGEKDMSTDNPESDLLGAMMKIGEDQSAFEKIQEAIMKSIDEYEG